MKILVILLAITSSLSLYATDVTVKGADIISVKSTEAKLSIKHMGTLNDNPKISIADKVLTIAIPNSGLGAKINKKVNGSQITATMTGDDTVAVSVALPYSLKGREADVTMTLREGAFDVHFPRVEVAKKAVVKTEVSRAPGVVEPIINAEAIAQNSEAEKLDESYLSTLVKNQEKLAEEKHPEVVKVQKGESQNGQARTDTDRVTLTQASTVKNNANARNLEGQNDNDSKSNFSIAGYVGKFVAFLAIMIAGFYGVLTLFKKGVIKKGKLGFLHSTKLVEVLSTTHIAPKRSLMMVKAHKQVFLISNSETGVQFLSEIQDVSGLIKSGEEEITGTNFDTNLSSASKTDKEFKLKEDVVNGYDDDFPMDSLDDMLNDAVPARAVGTNASRAIEKKPIQDQVRFSDQIKTKVKNLKQL